MSSTPTVSVIIVFHRDTEFLRPTIGSVMAQTFADFELLLIDNGTGLSADALGEYGRDTRVRFVRLPRNEGIPGGHNAGIKASIGEFVALLDYDDLMRPTRLAEQVSALRAGLDLVSSRVRRIDEKGTPLGREFTLTQRNQQYAYSQYAAPFPTPACTARRKVFLSLPYRADFPFAADFDFQARAVETFKTGAVENELLDYRWYRAQTTQDKAAAIETERATIRLMTGRRRHGRSELPDETKARISQGSPNLATVSRRAATVALTEGLHVLAAYQARRMIVYQKNPANAAAALLLAFKAVVASPKEKAADVARMFLRGPVKALAVTP
jgi:hypothetical protein